MIPNICAAVKVSVVIQNPKGNTYIKCQDLGAIRALVPVYADKSLTALEETCLETDDDELHSRTL